MALIPAEREGFIKPRLVTSCAGGESLHRRWCGTAWQRMEVSTQWCASGAIMASATNRLALGLPSKRLLQEATSIGGKGGRRRVLRGTDIDHKTDANSQIDAR